ERLPDGHLHRRRRLSPAHDLVGHLRSMTVATTRRPAFAGCVTCVVALAIAALDLGCAAGGSSTPAGDGGLQDAATGGRGGTADAAPGDTSVGTGGANGSSGGSSATGGRGTGGAAT